MTLKDAFMFKAGPGANSADASAALEFAGLDPAAEWNPAADNCSFYDALCGAILRGKVGVKQEAEGGYSITYDPAARSNYAYQLAQESGCQSLVAKYNPQPKVRDKSNRW